ncbi:ATP-binding protein [Verrucomicrobiota bacterium]
MDTILLCKCAHWQTVPADTWKKVLAALAGRGVELAIVEDLCQRAAVRDPSLADLAGKKELTVAACYPRTVKWLLTWAGAMPESGKLTVLNMRGDSTEDAIESLPGELGAGENVDISPSDPEPVQEMRWFPVLDYDRCQNCKQCISFCPFGVYTLDEEGAVRVVNPQNCKDNCPACARMCPSVAIIFPKVKDTPINGDVVKDEEVERRKAEAVRERLKDGDIHSILAKRRARAKQRKLASE